MDKETRTFSNDIEVRLTPEGKEQITGYAIVFNQRSKNLGGFVETIAPEALQGADVSDVVALFNHDRNMVLGRTPSTLTLERDEHGLRYFIDPPATTVANDLLVSIRRGDVRGSSFGFTIKENGDKWEKPAGKGEPWHRTITAFNKIYDVSPVTDPAYPQTDTSVAKRELGMLRDQVEREETEALELERAKNELLRREQESEINTLSEVMRRIADKYKNEE